MERRIVRRLLSLLVIIVLAIPAFFVWAFLLVDVSTNFDLNPIVKALWLAVMVLPLISGLWYLGGRILRAMANAAATPAMPAAPRWLGWLTIGVLTVADADDVEVGGCGPRGDAGCRRHVAHRSLPFRIGRIVAKPDNEAAPRVARAG